MKRLQFADTLRRVGPGIAVAATGVGAGDLIAAAVSGATYGTAILWAAAIGALIKFALNEGIGRWQLATGTTLLEGWSERLHPSISAIFLIYLLIWSFIVAGALIAACGLAAFALVGGPSVRVWGFLHSLAALVLVIFGRYAVFERLMKLFIALMFIIVLTCAFMLQPDLLQWLHSLFVPRVPHGAGKFLLGVMGGVGGSVTLLNYGYWIQEKNWQGPDYMRHITIDLGIAYSLTGLFGIAIMLIAAGVHPGVVQGNQMALEIGLKLQNVIGPVGKWAFLLGFWGAVFSSMLGVWQGVPYIFTDFVSIWRARRRSAARSPLTCESPYYKIFLLYLALPPVLLLFLGKPVILVIVYSITGALFMPFLAGTLLFLNNRRRLVGPFANGLWRNLLLIVSLLLFGYLCAAEIADFW